MANALSWADHRVFENSGNPFLFAVEDASLFSLSTEAHDTVRRWRSLKRIDPEQVLPAELEILEGLRAVRVLRPAPEHPAKLPLPEPGTGPLTALVLEVAQDCNLRCTYCYAEGGTYGAAACLLAPETARAAVRHLVNNSGDQKQLTLILFGGEPLMNMPAVRAAVAEADFQGEKTGKKVRCSITTNGTLLNGEIVRFLHEHRISVAVSLDGPKDIHDRNRPDAMGKGSYTEIIPRLNMLLANAPVPVAARVTLLPEQWGRVVEVFDHLVGLGFHEVGIAPVSPVSKQLLPSADQEMALLQGFGALARRFVAGARQGRVLPFANILDLLARIHLGQTRRVSCGAGYGYMAVDAKGRFFPCHRLAGEPDFCVGSLSAGVDGGRIRSSLCSLNHGREESCSKCWARTLCGGGCHYENHLRENHLGLPRGTSCGFIRSWLGLGMKTYVDLRTDDAIEAMAYRLGQRAKA